MEKSVGEGRELSFSQRGAEGYGGIGLEIMRQLNVLRRKGERLFTFVIDGNTGIRQTLPILGGILVK